MEKNGKFWMGFFALIVAVAAVSVGVTLAAWSVQGSTTNVITIGQVNVELIDQYPDGVNEISPNADISKVVAATNTGNVDCYIRVLLKKHWYTSYPDAPIPDRDLGQNKGAGQDYSKLLLSQIKPDYETDKWYRGSDVDGYECWYYKEIVAPNESADPLFRTFKLEWDDAEQVANQNYIGGIEVFAEALQADNVVVMRDSNHMIVKWPNGLTFSAD